MHLWKLLGLVAICASVLVHAEDPSHEEDANVAEAEDHGEAEGEEHEDHGEAEGEEHEEEHKPHWSYRGEHNPDNWEKLHELCKSSNPRQSPIDINPKVSMFDDDLTKIQVVEKMNKKKKYEIVNNGHSVNIQIEHEVKVTGGNLPSKGYRIAGVHFHWGSSDTVGSEHTVNSNRFPLEMHMVTYDTERYPELGVDAIFGDNSLAVLGAMFTISEEDNPTLIPLIDGLKRVQEAGSKTTIRGFPISELLPEQTDKYFRYFGSLTTPPCAESVVWTLFLHTQTISSAQLAEFRKLTEPNDDHIEDNYRPVQPIHKRVVYRSFLFKSEMSQAVVNYGKAAQEPDQSDATRPIVGVITLLSLLLAYML